MTDMNDTTNQSGSGQHNATAAGSQTPRAPQQPAPPAAAAPAAGEPPAKAPERGEGDKYGDALRRFSGDLRMSQQVFASMEQRQVPIEPHHWQLLLRAHLDGRDLAGARQVVERMRAAGVDVDSSTRWQVAVATGHAGQADAALTQLDQLHGEGVEPPAEQAAGVLSIYLAAARYPAARAVVRQMAQRGQAAGDADYERLLRDCLDRRAIKDTRSLIDLMVKVGRAPAPKLATDLIAMIARAGHTQRALDLLTLLQGAGVAFPGDVHTELLLAHAKAGNAAAAEASLEDMRADGTQPTSFHRNAVLQAYLAGEDIDGAWAAALGLADDGRIPSGDNLDALIELSLACKRLAAASGVIDWMLILGIPIPPQRAADVLTGHLKAGELNVAVGLYKVMAHSGVPIDRRAARDIVERLIRAKRLDEARTILEELRVAGTLTHGRHYGSLLSAFTAAKRGDDALALLRHMLDKNIAPASADASKLVGGLVRSGSLGAAGELIGSLQAAKVSVDEPTYRELMWAHAKRGEYDPAKAAFDHMVAAGITPDDRHSKALEWASGETKRRLPDEADGSQDTGSAAPEPGSETQPRGASGTPAEQVAEPGTPAEPVAPAEPDAATDQPPTN